MTREICKICYHVNSVGFDVPDDIWNKIIPTEFQDKVVCLNCFTRLGDEKYIDWSDDIKFYPVSLVRHQEITIYESGL